MLGEHSPGLSLCIVTPTSNPTVRQKRQTVAIGVRPVRCSAGCDCLDVIQENPRRAPYRYSLRSVGLRAIADLTKLVPAPGLHLAIRRQRHAVGRAGGDGLRFYWIALLRQHHHCYRTLAGYGGVTELTSIIGAPRPERSVGPQGQAELVAGCNGHDVEKLAQRAQRHQ